MKILIAEDDTSSSLLLAASLQKLGFDVTATQDGQEACEALQGGYFPVLITDWQMPRMDGLELCRHVRAHHSAPYPYIILLTIMGGKTNYVEGMNAGADDFITKPFDEDQLAARLRAAARVLDLYEALRVTNKELEQRVQERTAELTMANAQLEASREMAEAGSRAKSEFLLRMGHELRTPLNAILGFSSLLQMDNLDPEQTQSVGQIRKGGHHLLELINGMLDVTHLNKEAPALELQAVDIIPLLREAIDGVRPLAARHHIKLSADLTDNAPAGAIVLADRKRLAQVLAHLLSNAIKFNREAGKVTVCYEKVTGNRLRIDVRDSGPGIAPQHIEKLFTAFERLGAEQRGIEGVGIGLALSKWLIEAMDGRITAQSTLSEGSTFSVELALEQAPLDTFSADLHTPDSHTPHSLSAASATVHTVLYIEDDLSNQSLVEDILLRRPNIRLLLAANGQRGLELAGEHLPDLILLDFHLPDITGDQVLRHLREAPETQHIPVIVVSGDAMPQQVGRMHAAGAVDYFTKPFEVKEFLQVIDAVLTQGDQ